MNVILCGMMGSGKTTVSLALAKLMGFERADTDEYIVSRYGNISEIFEKQGEAYFRGLETQVAAELSEKDRLVISTGGGLVLNKQNVELLRKNGVIVYLRANLSTLVKRLSKDKDRPLLKGGESLEKRLASLSQERAPIYEEVSNYTVDVDGKTPEEIAGEIAGHVQVEK